VVAGLHGRQWTSALAREGPAMAVTAVGGRQRRGTERARGMGRKPNPMAAYARFEWKGKEKGGGAPAVAVVCGGHRPRRRAAAPVAGGWLPAVE